MAEQTYPIAQPSSAEAESRIFNWVATVDHKEIGILYLATTFAFFLIGGLEALLLRIQLAAPRATVLSPEAYNQLFTMHGTTMIFLVVMPVLIGFANYLVPLLIGARDMAFPRLNAMGYWLLLFGGLLLYYSFLAGGAPDGMWFMYAPLTERPYTTNWGPDFWAGGLLVTSVGTIAASINLIVTIVQLRAPGLTFRRLSIFVWTVLINSFLILWTMPSIAAAMVLLLIDRRLGA